MAYDGYNRYTGFGFSEPVTVPPVPANLTQWITQGPWAGWYTPMSWWRPFRHGSIGLKELWLAGGSTSASEPMVVSHARAAEA
jgi:hypothetical protein